jgi:hypothetical protein
MSTMILRTTTPTVVRATDITIDPPPEQPIALFTAEEERRWAGWLGSSLPGA